MIWRLVDGSKSDESLKGLGGAGIYYEDKNGEYYVIGVHSSYDKPEMISVGYRMRKAVFDQIKLWMQDSKLPEFEIESNNENYIRTKGLKK